ncbi:hypothetical protein SAURM35S_00431 [Streptomyces aurantiogriseus]
MSTPDRSRYSPSAPCNRAINGPTRTATTGIPSRTTAASSGEVDSSNPATTTYTVTEPTPGPITVSD